MVDGLSDSHDYVRVAIINDIMYFLICLHILFSVISSLLNILQEAHDLYPLVQIRKHLNHQSTRNQIP
jgi:hypothetical protein